MKGIYGFIIVMGCSLCIGRCPAQVPELVLPIGHSAQVKDACYSPDGKKILTISEDRTVKIWNAEDGRLLLTLDGFSVDEIVSSGKFSPDGRSILTRNELGAIRIWDSNNGKLLLVPESESFPFKPSSSDRNNASYSPDGKFLFVIQDSVLNMWDIRGNKLLKSFSGKKGGIRSFDFSPDGKTFMTYSSDGTIEILDIKSGFFLRSFHIRTRSNPEIVFTRDGRNITTFADGEFNIYDSGTGRQLTSIGGIKGSGAIYNPDGTKILALAHLFYENRRWKSSSEFSYSFDVDSGAYEAIIPAIYDRLTGKLLTAFVDSSTIDNENYFIGSHTTYSNFTGFSPDGKNVISVWDKCRVWDSESGRLLFALEGQFENFLTLYYTPDSKRILVIKEYSSELYDAKTGKLLRSYEPSVTRRYFLDSEFTGDELNDRLSQYSGALVFPEAGLSPDGRSFYIVPVNSNSVKTWDTQSGDIKAELTGSSAPVTSASLSSDGMVLISKSSSNGDMLRIWDLTHGKMLHSFAGREFADAIYSDDGMKLMSVSSGKNHRGILRSWDALSGRMVDSILLKADNIRKGIMAPDQETIVTIDSSYEAKLLNAHTGEIIVSLKGPVSAASYSPDSKIVATTSWFSGINLWNVKTGQFITFIGKPGRDTTAMFYQTIDSLGNTVSDTVAFVTSDMKYNELSDKNKNFVSGILRSVKFSSDAKELIETGNGKIWNTETAKLINSFQCSGAELSPDGHSALINEGYGDGPLLFDLVKGRLISKLNFRTFQDLHMQYSIDGKSIITSSWDSAKVWDATDGNLKQVLHFSGYIFDTDWKRNRIIVHDNSKLVFYDLLTGKKLFTFIAIDVSDYLIVTPDNYYMGTKNAAAKLSWRVGNNLYRFDQFDLQYNRPDIVLQRLGNSDSSLIGLYRNAYEKRLSKLGFTEKMFSSEWHIPEVEVLNYDSIDIDPEKSTVKLIVRGADNKYNIDRIMIRVNGVPEHGKGGWSVANERKDTIDKSFTVKLSKGSNNISVSCINEKGVESYRQSVDIVNNNLNNIKPDLYIIGMSVSSYRDKRFNLEYAVKDGRDIAGMFNKQGVYGETYNKIHTDTIFNKAATKSGFMDMRKILEKTGVDDQVIVYVSGHGMLDSKLDFYFATWDMDFQKPEKKGLSFDNLESILDDIPARRKLLMMDACHSGEVDKDESEDSSYKYNGTHEDIAFRGIVKEYKARGEDAREANSGLNMSNSFELMQELFAGLDQGTGTNVISAAGGRGYALESPAWNNGVFTYTIINGIRNLAADKNHDEKISVSELRDYSIGKVQELTGGSQRPTSRRETLNFDWIIH